MIFQDAGRAFGWPEDVAVAEGPRGALGQIWRVDTGSARYALKQIFFDPPSESAIEAELAFARRAAGAGVALPRSHPDREGRYLHTTPSGAWLRLYDWFDLRPVGLTAPATPRELGTLFARLHLCAPAATEQPDSWYETVPTAGDWAEVGTPYTLPALPEVITPSDPARLIVCHRDLHPENVLADPTGALVVVDWDNLGPADPGRELAQALFAWFADPTVNLHAMRAMYEAYVDAGGTGRITEPADFTMLAACRLNFLLVQTRVLLDPAVEPRHREWAQCEVDEVLRTLPTPRDLADVLAVLPPC